MTRSRSALAFFAVQTVLWSPASLPPPLPMQSQAESSGSPALVKPAAASRGAGPAEVPPVPPRPGPGRAGAVFVLGAGVLGSRLLGFFRDMVIAALLGSGADAFLTAFRVPNFFRRLLAEGSLAVAYTQAAAGRLSREGPEAARRFGQSAALSAAGAAALLALPALLLAQPLCFLLAPGLSPGLLQHSARLLQICLLYIPFCLFSAIAFAHAGLSGRHLPQAWGPAVWNGVILGAGLTSLLLQSIQHATPESGYLAGRLQPELLLCLAVALGGIVQALFARRCLAPWHIRALLPGPEHDSRQGSQDSLAGQTNAGQTSAPSPCREILLFLGGLPWRALGAAPHQLHALAGTALASFAAPGSISALYFAERLIELPLGLAGAAVGLALLPRLASAAASREHEEFCRLTLQGIRQSAFFSLPAAAGLWALAGPLAALLFGHGAYSGEAVQTTAAALHLYALGLPALCAARPLISAVQALQPTAPLRTALQSLAVVILVALPGLLAQADHPVSAKTGPLSQAVCGRTAGLPSGADAVSVTGAAPQSTAQSKGAATVSSQSRNNLPPSASPVAGFRDALGTAAPVAAALALGAWINAWLLLRVLRRRPETSDCLRAGLRAGSATLLAYTGAALLLALFLCRLLPPDAGPGPVLAAVAASTGSWLLLFAVAGDSEALALCSWLRRSREG